MVAKMGRWGMNILEHSWRKGPWTSEEDNILSQHVTLHGEGRWSSVSTSSGLNRSGKSCRLRWVNYLRPGLKRGQITPQEEGIIIELHALWGNKWATIARYLPGRTDNEIKNFWRTRFKKDSTKSSHDNQKRLLQKKRSQALKDKFQKERLLRVQEENVKTTTIYEKTTFIASALSSDQAETEIINYYNNQDSDYNNNNNNMIFSDDLNLHGHEGSTADLLSWTEDRDYGFWGVLWNNIDDDNINA